MTERGSKNIASHADVLRGLRGGPGAATRDEPLLKERLRGRLGGIETQYTDRKAFCFVPLSSFSLLSSFPTETPNSQVTVLSSS